MTIGPGSVINERYALQRELGAGGMAEVYLAHDDLLDRQVAVKVLSARYAADPAFVERFRREASSAAGLNHPNIVAVYDRGETDGSYYIVMEYLDGPNLKEVIRRRAPLEPPAAIDYALQILAALGAAHRRDIIHLDAKPQNMLIAEDGLLKVTDFGIARAGGRSDLTATGSVIGTAQYLSPEQARGDDVTAASDCYSAGIVLYELLTGRVPFDGDQPMAVAMKQINDPPTPPKVHQPGLPDDLNAVVMKALAKRPSERYRTVEEFAQALRPIRERYGGATTAVIGAVAAATAGTQVMRRPEPTAPTRVASRRPPPRTPPQRLEPSRRRGWWIAALVVLIVAAVAGGLVLLNGGIGGGDDGITIPNVAGSTLEEARQELTAVGLENIGDASVNDDTVPAGIVVGTKPVPGQKITADSRVVIEVSAGPDRVPLPDVRNQQFVDAVAALEREGFTNTERRDDDESDEAEGVVTGQTPEGGTDVAPNAPITLFVSTGPQSVEVPDLAGADRNTALRRLEDLGLDPRVTGEPNGIFTPNTVVRTEPGSGTTLERGSQILVIVAQQPSDIGVPDVIGQTRENGTALLEGRGFRVSSRAEESSTDAGLIIDQSPGPDTEVPSGSTVSIVVSAGLSGDEAQPGEGDSAPPAPSDDEGEDG